MEPSSTSGVATVVVSDEQTDVELDAHRWADLAAAVLRTEGRVGELTLTFVDTDEIAALNAEHMGKTGPTDVLSFPLDSIDDTDHAMPGPVLLGDVVLCPAVASDAAPTHAGTLDDELALLVVHGILHLLGMDHEDEDEATVMEAREQELLDRFHRRVPPPPAPEAPAEGRGGATPHDGAARVRGRPHRPSALARRARPSARTASGISPRTAPPVPGGALRARA